MDPQQHDFVTLSTPVDDAEGVLWHVPDGWQQGRGAFGGLVLAAMTRAAERTVDPELALRSLSATLPRPVLPGAARIELSAPSDGKHTALREVRLVQDDHVAATASCVFGRARGGDDGTFCDLPAPADVTPWHEAPVAPMRPPLAPVFTPHLEYRSLGPPPFMGSGPRESLGWVRFRNPGTLRDAALVMALTDAWWPTALAAFDAPRPLATIHTFVQIVGTFDGLDPDAPFLHRARSDAALQGYLAERRELFGHDGRLIAVNQQTFVLIR